MSTEVPDVEVGSYDGKNNDIVSTMTSAVVTKTSVTVLSHLTKADEKNSEVEDEDAVLNECEGDAQVAGHNHGDKGEDVDGNVSVLGVDNKGADGGAIRDSLQIHGVDKGGSLNENGGDSDASMSEAEDNVGDSEHQYLPGDYVWGKIKHYPWWPGRIYNPSDASDTAEKLKKNDHYLVAYAGDGTFAWCTNSQLNPFDENFVKFSKQSQSKNFLNALESALGEIGQVEESNMTCSCMFKVPKFRLTKPVADNYGVKAGVLVLDGGKDKISRFNPAEILAELQHLAQVVSVENRLVVTLLKGKLAAFYQAKGGFELPVYQLPQFIIGLEDKDGTDRQLSVSDEDPDWLSSPEQPANNTNQSLPSKGPIFADDKLYKRRKSKTIAEMIDEDTDDVKYKIQGVETSKPASKPRGRPRKISAQDDALSGEDKSSGKRKKTKLVVVPPSPKKDQNSGGGSPEKDQIDGGLSHDNKAIKRETEIGSSPRERKKSRYLSHPFLQPERREKTSSPSQKESETGVWTSSGSSKTGERMSKVVNELLYSPSLFKCSTDTNGGPTSWMKKSVRKIVVDPIIAETDVTEVLKNIRGAATGHVHFSIGVESFDTMKIFFSLFRSTMFCNGYYYDSYKDLQLGKKRKSPNTTEENSTESRSRKMKSKKNETDSGTADTVGYKPSDEASERSTIDYMKEKLERVTSIVDKLDGSNVSMETKVDLESELMKLLSKVKTLRTNDEK